jgi:deoxycytidylate deaminase
MAVGAVVTFKNQVISVGYNGPPSGEDHCKGNVCPLSEEGGCTRSLHAEANALLFANTLHSKLMQGVQRKKARSLTVYSTHATCVPPYREQKKGFQALKIYDIDIHRITSSGYVVDYFTNKIVENIE